MKILFNTPNANLKGGPPTHLPWLEAELRRQLEVISFHYGRKSDAENILQKVLGRLTDLRSVRRLIHDVKPDLIHHNSAFDPRAILRDAPLASMTKKHGVPLFIKVHGSLPEAFSTQSQLIKKLRDRMLHDATAFGVLSRSELEEFEEHFPETKGKMFVVKNILKPDFFEVERHESEQPTILFISRCVRRKGVFNLLSAVPQILGEVPNARFIIVGDGEDAAEVDRVIRELHLGFCVERKPHCTNAETKKYYSTAHTFVFPTHFPEGMPMVIAEAMAAGVPIVTTRTRFSMSYMKEGEHCLYSSYGDASHIAEQVVRLLKSNETRRTMSAANRALAMQFSAEAVTREFIGLYCHLLGDTNQELSQLVNAHLETIHV